MCFLEKDDLAGVEVIVLRQEVLQSDSDLWTEEDVRILTRNFPTRLLSSLNFSMKGSMTG